MAGDKIFMCAKIGDTIYFLENFKRMNYEFNSKLPLTALGSVSSGYNQAFGMTQAQADSLYAGTELEGKVTIVNNGWQQIELNKGKYKITVQGADGGSAGTLADKQFVKGGRGALINVNLNLPSDSTLLILVGNHGWCNAAGDWGASGGGATVVMLLNEAGSFNSPTGAKIAKCIPLIVAGGGAGRTDENRDKVNDISVDSCPLNAKPEDGVNTNNGTTASAVGGAGLVNILSGTTYHATADSTSNAHGYTFGGGGSSYNGGGGGGGYSGGNGIDSYPSQGGTSFVNTEYCEVKERGLRPYAVEPSQNGYVRIK